ncbi:ABC transporter permease [Azospirillum brasilense]|uniref:ABC transporter permease n=1 Tax=Azospirillum brasilense TaxID=192 RepID=A0A0P0EAQ9_AZOBR|nr:MULTISPECIES: ABC transporter permease [Azospirillum]ALJ34569.1 ABC transporter permease [Azospirillum brasilense]MDW7554076.1 ABC transporter permease [Azospirillum brasilense]MDW7592957.1 ABC transporter permease [Azospirillum brasilense]MDW7593665.1 ABC transporter permease [Azospirillum brasilense]MDW7627092.1 ABC transporter permease [Azospirillum brasilense]
MRWRRLAPVLSLALLVGLWAVAAELAASRSLPGPAAVLSVLVREAADGALFYHLGITLARMAAAFVIAMSIGSALGILLGRSATADRLFGLWLTVFLNIPALVVIVLAYVWFGLTEAAAVGAVAVNKIPNVVVVLREGTRAIDEQYVEMARTFRMARSDVLRHVLLPQLTPYFAAAARSGLALIWKIVLVVELLGRSDGVGFQIHLFFQMFDVAGILAYTVAFVAVVQLLELCVLQPVEQRLTRWRPVRAEA